MPHTVRAWPVRLSWAMLLCLPAMTMVLPAQAASDPADAEFAAATSYVVVERKILWVGDLAACVITQTRTTGTYQKQVLDLIGTETMLLRRSGDGWLIQHAHWSAHPAADAPPAPVAAHK